RGHDAVEVGARRDGLAGVVAAVPADGVDPFLLYSVDESADDAAAGVEDFQANGTGLREGVPDLRKTTEWIGLVLVKHDGACVKRISHVGGLLHRDRVHGIIEGAAPERAIEDDEEMCILGVVPILDL